MILAEFVIKLIVIPVVFLFAMTCLAYGFVQRKISQPVHGAVSIHS
jgi:hypothetical protein